MTKEEWKRTEDALNSFFAPVCLKVDGYNVTLILERVGTYKNMIMVYIDGKWQGKWLTEGGEERRRFCQRKTHSLLTAKEKMAIRKLSKKAQKELANEHHNFQYESYSPQWTSFGALKKHLISNNEKIELIKIG